MKTKHYILLLLASFSLLTQACTEEQLERILGGITEEEAARGLKEALTVSTDTAVSILSTTNGYYNDPLVKIPFPPEANTIKNTIELIPGGKVLVDEVVLTLNRAAEHASVKAKPIFIDAVTSMTISDAFSILYGGDTAATVYLKQRTYANLTNAFAPDIDNSLSAVGADVAWQTVVNQYNQLPLVTPLNPDLGQYATEKALDGLFEKLAFEEKRIREDPLHRVTELLQKVFSSADND